MPSKGRITAQPTQRTTLTPQRRNSSTFLALPRIVRIVVGSVVTLVIVLLTLLLMTQLPIFTIESISAEPSEHVSAEAIATLAEVETGTTLLSVDVDDVEAHVCRNPWIASAHITRVFPDKLQISVEERQIGAVVLMSSGNIGWYVGTDGVWIEPFNIETEGERTGTELAQEKAREHDCVLICDIPSTVAPVAGEKAQDLSVEGALVYLDELSDEFLGNVLRFSAQSRESISCTLNSGVEVSLGAPSSISSKEAIVEEILSTHPEQVTYINVRVPGRPSYRLVGTESVQAGTGALADDGFSEDGSDSTDSSDTTDTAATPQDFGVGTSGQGTP